MAKWTARLTGHDFDLEELPKVFCTPRLSVVFEDGAYLMRSKDFDVLDGAGAVRAVALGHLERVNGIMRLVFPDFRPVGLGELSFEERTHHVLIAESVEFRTKLGAVVLSKDGRVPAPSEAEPPSWVTAAIDLREAAMAFRLLAKPNLNWQDLYKLLEIVQENGGSHLIGTPAFSKKAVSRFTQTANSMAALGDHARHAKAAIPAPVEPMGLQEALVLVRSLVREWVRLLTAPRPDAT